MAAEDQTSRFWLDVTPADEAKASALGALYDPAKQRWYITSEVCEERFEDFEQWRVFDPYSHWVFTGVYALQANYKCFHCSQLTPVICIFTTDAVMPGETWDPTEEDIDHTIYVFCFVKEVDTELAKALELRFPFYSKDKMKETHQGRIYLNHCVECGEKISEKSLHDRGPDMPFPFEDPLKEAVLYRLHVPLPAKIAGSGGNYGSQAALSFDRLLRNAK